jgi:glycosyltransferase involved in cell wall biosynthesis
MTSQILSTPLRVAWISSFVPKRCGIATFSRDLIEGIELADPTVQINIAAAESGSDELTYGPRVVTTTLATSRSSFVQAGRMLASNDPDVIVLQHEFGLYGGSRTDFKRGERTLRYPTGDNIFSLLEVVDAPLITTLHTVLDDPDSERREIIQRLGQRSEILVTMTRDAKDLLVSKYDIDPDHIAVIPHGVPSVPPIQTALAKSRLGVPQDEPIMMITGLIGGNKGIDIAIKALPEILKHQPKLKLYVCGQTHPEILAHSGEALRESLQALAEDLGVADSVVFVNRYLPLDELVEYLQAADLYLTLHGDAEQAASGTLAYALGAGLVAISTPYRYAKEVLSDGHGFLVPFGDYHALSETVIKLMGDKKLYAETKEAALNFGASMSWPIVGRSYVELMHSLAQN